MRVTLRVTTPTLAGDLRFELITQRLPSTKSVTTSFCIHVAVVAALAGLSSHHGDQPRPNQPMDPPSILRLGEHVYYVTPLPKKSVLDEPVRKQAQVVVRREIPRKPKTELILLQPATVHLAPQDVQLPSLRLLSTQPQLPKFRKEFVVPGISKPRDVPAPPKVLLPPPDIPVVTPAADVKTPTILLMTGPPAVVPPTAPRDVPAPQRGEAVNVVAAVPDPLPVPPKLIVPPGNVAPTTAPEGLITNVTPGPVQASVSDSGTEVPGRRAAAPPLPGTVILRPKTGTFDAVVVQTSSLDQFPGARNLLSGRPIYTVFVSVETARDWALYFCVPGKRPQQGGTTDSISLTAVVPVSAPYPTRIVRPSVKVPSYFKSLLVFGSVNAQGRMEHLKMIQGVGGDVDVAILTSLAAWEFRPATSDGVPVGVEFLLSIPVAGL